MHRWIILLLLLFAGPLQAQLFETTPPPAEAPTKLPSPLNLTPDWWQYFTGSPEELNLHTEELRGSLTRLLDGVPPEQRQQVDSRIQKLLVNLRALPSAKQQPTAEPFVAPAEQSTYTIPELLRLVQEIEQVRDILANEQSVVEQTTTRLTDGGKQLDTQMAEYLSIGEPNVDKLLLGLDIMGGRSSLAVLGEQLRVQKSRLDQNQARFSYLQGALLKGREKLVPGRETPTALERQIEQSEMLWEDAQRRRFQAESDAVSAISDSPLSQANSLRLQQRAIQAAVEESDARMLHLRNVIHRYVLLSLAKDETFLLREPKADEWKGELTTSLRRGTEWQEASRAELNRAGDALSALTTNTGSDLRNVLQQRIDGANQTLLALQKLEVTQKEVELLLQLFDREKLSRASGVVRFGSWITTSATEFTRDGFTWMQEALFRIGGVPVTPFGILRAILIVLLTLWLSRLVQRALERAADQQWGIARSTFYAVSRLIHYFLLTLGVVLALASLGLDFSNLALVFGALSVGIGFGLQSIVNNFLSGLIILFERPLRVGDYLELESGYRGRVTAINVRSTHLRTNDGIDVVIPNAEIVNGRVINWTMRDAFRRVHVPFGVAYGSDKEVVRKAVLEAAERVTCTLQGVQKYGEPEVWLVGFGDSALNFELIVWVNARAAKQYQRTMAAYYWEIHTALEEAGITIPFPQQDIYVKSLPSNPTL